jgi:hypothetical protein
MVCFWQITRVSQHLMNRGSMAAGADGVVDCCRVKVADVKKARSAGEGGWDLELFLAFRDLIACADVAHCCAWLSPTIAGEYRGQARNGIWAGVRMCNWDTNQHVASVNAKK